MEVQFRHHAHVGSELVVGYGDSRALDPVQDVAEVLVLAYQVVSHPSIPLDVDVVELD